MADTAPGLKSGRPGFAACFSLESVPDLAYFELNCKIWIIMGSRYSKVVESSGSRKGLSGFKSLLLCLLTIWDLAQMM